MGNRLYTVAARCGIALAVLAVWCVAMPAPAQAATGIRETLNYQARLLNAAGAVVPDGNYNLEFKIYQDGTGCVSSGSAPCSGTLKWTETRTLTNRVTVKNGYFSVALGEVTAFGTSVDWNQDTLWLSVNIGGTANTPSWDGEMVPFRRLAAATYALNAKQLGGLDASKFLQLAPTAAQGDTSTLASLFINKTGASGNLLQLRKNGTDGFVVNNDGTVRVGAVDTTGTLVVFDTKTTAGDPTGITGGMYYNSNSNAFRCYDTSWTNCGSSLTLQDVYNNSPDLILNDDDTLFIDLPDTANDPGFVVDMQCDVACDGLGQFVVQDDGVDVFRIEPGDKYGSATFQVTSDIGTAFQILNAAGIPMFQIDTTAANNRVYIGSATPDNVATLLVLDEKTDSTDPTNEYNGSMYYNSGRGKFRCYEENVWKDCVQTQTNLTFNGTGGQSTDSTWTNMPAGINELFGTATNRMQYDLSDMTQIRFQVNVAATGAPASELLIQYSTDGVTWNYLDDADTGLGQSLASTGFQTSDWEDIATDAHADVYLRVVGADGNGSADPRIGLVQLQVR